jgi:hypothetical protein
MRRGTGTKIVLLLLLAGVAALLFVALQKEDSEDGGGGGDTTSAQTTTGGEPAPPAEPAPEVIEMKDGAPVEGVRELEYEKGDQVRILVKLDEPQEDVHIHGYDVEKTNAGGKVLLEFPANLDGAYELEAHGPSGDVLLAELRVNP